MKKISKMGFLVKYVLNFILIHFVLVVLESVVLEVLFPNENDLALIELVFIILKILVTPIFSSYASFNLSIKNVVVIEDGKNTENQLIIALLIGAIVGYISVYEFALSVLVIYVIGIWISYIMLMKSQKNKLGANNSKQENGENSPIKTYEKESKLSSVENQIQEDNRKDIMKQYQLEKFNAECVQAFLRMNRLNENHFFYAIQLPTFGEYALYGNLAGASQTNYIVNFDERNIYMFELSKMSNKKIVNSIIFPVEDMIEIKTKDVVLGIARKITITFKNKQKIIWQANKNLKEFPSQNESVIAFMELKDGMI